MIKLSVLYPTTEGAIFDHECYRDEHVPLCCTTWGLGSAEIDKGNGPYEAAVHFRLESMEALQAALGAAGTSEVRTGVANYTTITPIQQLSEIVT
jgi:uncharacterized protein (TIGR02118 family)